MEFVCYKLHNFLIEEFSLEKNLNLTRPTRGGLFLSFLVSAEN